MVTGLRTAFIQTSPVNRSPGPLHPVGLIELQRPRHAVEEELIGGLGAHSVIEAVGTQESMMQAIRSTRPGGHVGFVGVSRDVQVAGEKLFFSAVHLHGGPAPVRRFLPEQVELGSGTAGPTSVPPGSSLARDGSCPRVREIGDLRNHVVG